MAQHHSSSDDNPSSDSDAEDFPDTTMSPMLPSEDEGDELLSVSNDQTIGSSQSRAQVGRNLEPLQKEFELIRSLGSGAFGEVILAKKHGTERLLAIKVPGKRFSNQQEFNAFVAEAKTAAKLQHPGLVSVVEYNDQKELPFIVMEYVDGGTLSEYRSKCAMEIHASVELLKAVAEALAHLHQAGAYHRDLKPSNILVDSTGRPHVADFGLAIDEETRRQRIGEVAGTLPYMSPEQVRGETNHIDGRSDMWSLGVIFYELLTGVRPFRSKGARNLIDDILNDEPIPPRQRNPKVSAELQRICLKCLEKRRKDRYDSMADLVDDLHHWLLDPFGADGEGSSIRRRHPTLVDRTVAVVPKGLRSFEPQDAGFFLELLPDPRDRGGIPECVRFWLSRIEGESAESPFEVGVLFGTSGSGKSSLIKAGVLPLLSADVETVFVSATPDDTQRHMLHSIQSKFGSTSVRGPLAEFASQPLPELLRHLRESKLPAPRKLLIVIDQFEQWLQAHGNEETNELINAVRQCNGTQLQALLVVRDDFWTSTTQFMDRVEVDMRVGHNAMAAPRFSMKHAERVLQRFGQAYEAVDDPPTRTQKAFVEKAVRELAVNDEVICVRLALFVEIMKQKPWTASALKSLGGMEGIGVTFLDNAFSTDIAPADYRQHAGAAKSILASMLPKPGQNIKGRLRSESELVEASGYPAGSKKLTQLVRILNEELRLVSMVEKPSNSSRRGADTGDEPPEPNFQLTHDYLVPSIRHWIRRGKTQDVRGRAELVLHERARDWEGNRSSRFLPSLMQFVAIASLVSRRAMTNAERGMMRAATQYYFRRIGVVVLCLLVVSAFATRQLANVWVRQLTAVSNDDIPRTRDKIEKLGWFASGSVHELACSDLLLTTDKPNLFQTLLASLTAKINEAQLEGLRSAARGPSASNMMPANDEDRLAIARRRTAAGFALLRLGYPKDAVASLFVNEQDPEAIYQFAHRCRDWGIHPSEVIRCLDALGDLRAGDLVEHTQPPQVIQRRLDLVRYALLLSLGEYPQEEWPEDLWDKTVERVVTWHKDDPSSAVHSATGWLLRSWDLGSRAEQVEKELAVDLPAVTYQAGKQWFVAQVNCEPNRFTDGELLMTFVVFEPKTYTVGSSDPRMQEEWPQHRAVLQAFAVLDRELSFEELWATCPSFYGDSGYAENTNRDQGKFRSFTGSSPAGFVSWPECAWCCRQLTSWSGFSVRDQSFDPPIAPLSYPFKFDREWPMDLLKTGFRLPLDREWEVARGTAGQRPIRTEWLPKYGWYSENSEQLIQPPRRLRPNLNGLFDIEGNVLEWCFDWNSKRPDLANSNETLSGTAVLGPQKMPNPAKRILRGSWFSMGVGQLKADPELRLAFEPQSQRVMSGFRPALTLTSKNSSSGD